MKIGVINSKPETKLINRGNRIKTGAKSNISFGGHSEDFIRNITPYCVYYRLESNRNIREEYPDMYLAIRDSKFYYPNSSIKRLCEFGPKSVYFADPMEIVSDEIQKKHSFIVYDNEPIFPALDSIKDCYYSKTARENWYRSKLKDIYEYHERLKTADNKELVSLETKRVPLQKDFENALKYKERYDQQYVENPWNHVPEEKEKADYYYSRAERKLYFIDEKINYYKDRIKNSQEQQALAIDLYNIFKEADQSFETRKKSLEGQERLINYNYSDTFKYKPRVHSPEDVPRLVADLEDKIKEREKKLELTKAWLDLQTQEYNSIVEANSTKIFNIDTEKEQERKQELSNLKAKIKNLSDDIESIRKTVAHLLSIPAEYGKLEKIATEVSNQLPKLYTKVEAFYKMNAHRFKCVR